MNITAADITSGNLGADIRNAIAWRKAWVARLAECDKFVSDYVKNTPLATYLAYSTDLQRGEIDWERETVLISFDILLAPDKNWAKAITGVVDAVYAGLAGTGQAASWKLDWPAKSASGGASQVSQDVTVRYNVAVQLLNEQGQVLGTQTLPLSAGFKTSFSGGKMSAASLQTWTTVKFPAVDGNRITDKLTIKIAGVDGKSAEAEIRKRGVSILTLAAYQKLFPVPVIKDMVYIEGGTFTMGSPASEPARGSDETQHSVSVSSFYMGKYEVTQKEYEAVMGKNPSYFKGGSLPVEQVSWYDAVEFCNAKSRKDGLTPAYTISGTNVTWNRNADGYRLPTEAEWEYACRAGTTTPFNTGNNIKTSQANYDGNYPYNGNAKGTDRGKTTAVGSFAPNAWGLCDMHGNVWEWCWDWYGSYASGAQTDPVGASSGGYRVGRGGGWSGDGQHLRSAYRFGALPSSLYGDNRYGLLVSIYGFRLVRNGT